MVNFTYESNRVLYSKSAILVSSSKLGIRKGGSPGLEFSDKSDGNSTFWIGAVISLTVRLRFKRLRTGTHCIFPGKGRERKSGPSEPGVRFLNSH